MIAARGGTEPPTWLPALVDYEGDIEAVTATIAISNIALVTNMTQKVIPTP